MFLLISAATYYYLTDPIMGYYVHLWAPTTGNQHYGLYAMAFACIYFLHLSRTLKLVYCSIRECQLAFKRREKLTIAHIKTAGSQRPSRRHATELLRPMKRVWRALFSQGGLFGVENEHFLTVYVFREMLELSSQTYQAYQYSRFLSRVWLNTLLVSMLVVNCWSTLAVQHFLGTKPALERVVAITVDAAISIAMCVVVPCLLVAPYANAMDTANSSFRDPDQLYDPVFITKLVLEFQLTFASSLTDFTAKVVPHVAVYMSLVSLGSLLTRSPKITVAVAITTESPDRWAFDVSLAESVEHAPSLKHAATLGRMATLKAQVAKRSATANKAVKLVLGLWGIVVLVFHIRAAILSRLTFVEGCRAFTRPWFTTRSSCVSLVVNCHARGIESPDDNLLRAIDETALATLTFAHCPRLRIPPAIQKLSNLMVLHVYNSTITDWSGDSNSISAAAHPRLFVTAVARTHFPSGFPAGLLQPLPASLLSIQFCVTDFTSLPDDLPSRWHPMAVVAFEYGALTEIPASLLSLQVFTLSLKGNRIETIPQLQEMPPDVDVPELSLTENPLRELPDKLGTPTTRIDRLDLQGTNLTALPPWTQTQVRKTNYMRGTPYCATVAPELQPANVQCGPRSVLDLNLDFPLEFIDAIYTIDRD
ncbi:hypothetical protein PR003_g23869 [Phytophthora rubi]|nr:hypothetical protein PR003_g23869 [Phytophthora rubi]